MSPYFPTLLKMKAASIIRTENHTSLFALTISYSLYCTINEWQMYHSSPTQNKRSQPHPTTPPLLTHTCS